MSSATIDVPQDFEEDFRDGISWEAFSAELISHKWETLEKHGEHVKSELQVAREWTIIKTQKFFWAISNKIDPSALHLLLHAYKNQKTLSIQIELRRSINKGPKLTAATLKFAAKVKSFRVHELGYFTRSISR